MKLIEAKAKNRKEELEALISTKQHELKKLQSRLPEGMIRTAQRGNSFQYYLRNSAEKNGKYIPKKKEKIAMEYSSREYCEKVICAAEEELAAIEKLLRFYDNHMRPEDVYSHMPLGKRVLINPIKVTDDEYITAWFQQNVPLRDYREETRNIETSYGEKVRSKSEAMIAELYRRKGIPYIYEKPLELKGIGIVRPDFTFLDIERRTEIYHEHLGMVDDEEYMNNAIHKIRLYEKNGIFIGDRLLITCETQKNPMDIKAVERTIDNILTVRH